MLPVVRSAILDGRPQRGGSRDASGSHHLLSPFFAIERNRNTLIPTCSHPRLTYWITLQQDKKLSISLNGNRKVVGTLRGYDAFLNIVLEDTETETGQYLGQIVIRGNSIVQLEGLERI